MQTILEEIRNLLQTNLKTTNSAESGTTDTNIKITAHGLINGDVIVNTSRGNVSRSVTVIDADNFTVESVSGQTLADVISFPKFKKFYVGYIETDRVAMNYCPVLFVYPINTNTGDRLTTARDKFEYSIGIKIITSAYGKIDQKGSTGLDLDRTLDAQKQCVELMEKITNDTPDAQSILGVLRRNISGTNYLYSLVNSITYNQGNKDGTIYYEAELKMTAVSRYLSRS